MSINRDEAKRCNRKATHMSMAWGFRACNKHAVGGMMGYNKELEPPFKYKKDYQRCDHIIYQHPDSPFSDALNVAVRLLQTG